MLVTAKRRPNTKARMSPAVKQEFTWTGSGLLSSAAGKEASIVRPFKGCVARKFSCSRESRGPHKETERVWSWGSGGRWIVQAQDKKKQGDPNPLSIFTA